MRCQSSSCTSLASRATCSANSSITRSPSLKRGLVRQSELARSPNLRLGNSQLDRQFFVGAIAVIALHDAEGLQDRQLFQAPVDPAWAEPDDHKVGNRAAQSRVGGQRLDQVGHVAEVTLGGLEDA